MHATTAGRPAAGRGAGRPGLLQTAAAVGRRLWLPAALLTTAMVLLGLFLTHVLAHGWLGTEDAAVDRELVSARSPAGNSVTAVFTLLASTPVVIGVAALAAGACRVAFGRWREAVFVALAPAGETAIFLLTTLAVHRSRPAVPHLDVAPPTSSFPSGHTAAALCCYGAIAAVVLYRYRQPVLRVAVVAVAALLPLLVGASRLYRGMHFPTDVLAGLLLGGSWLAVTTQRLLRRDGADPKGRAA